MILITGLGPGDIARIPGPVLDLLLDPGYQLVIRTVHHPAAIQLADQREVRFCDDLYEAMDSFDEVYSAISQRVIDAAEAGPVIYAVPGSPMVGEFAVRKILEASPDATLIPAESFVDAVLAVVGYDPFERGLQLINAHDLPSPLVIDKPTIVGHLDRPEVFAEAMAGISRVLPEAADITVLSGVGASDEVIWSGPIDTADANLSGYRTSVWIDTEAGGLAGVVRIMARLRAECPWDQEQTHSSLTTNLVEESYELIEAIDMLEASESDLVAYARVEEEVGDVLLQALFHAAIAEEYGAFDINDAAEVLRQKLVRRHPHVFGDVQADNAAEVKANWDAIKAAEKGERESAIDGIPKAMPSLHRAAKLLNRASKAGQGDEFADRLPHLAMELAEDEPSELAFGDAILAVVDLARRSGIDADRALRVAMDRFEARFRAGEHGR
jgi:tetrapyrrole methylase family protein / MazG family protein